MMRTKIRRIKYSRREEKFRNRSNMEFSAFENLKLCKILSGLTNL